MNSLASADGAPLPPLPTLTDIKDAAGRLAGRAVRTPLIESSALNKMTGGRLLIKAEMLQRTGSFKFRGAYNRISRLDAAEHEAGIITYSSGNHGQAVAAVAAMFSIPATVIMPADAPSMKLEATSGHGATVITYDRATETREEIAAQIMAKSGATLIQPFDDPLIIAGQGTAGLEIVEQADDIGVGLDAALVPCGGGGLIAGISTAIGSQHPKTQIYAVEPEAFDDTKRSLKSGKREKILPGGTSICDALLVPQPGRMTFAVNAERLAGGLSVTDAEVMGAMAVAFQYLKVVVEPGGAVALAAVLSGRFECLDRTVAIVCSGGNVDAETFDAALR